MASDLMVNMTGGVESIIGYCFTDPLILWEALQATGSGISVAGTRRFPEGNKRLAVLGDTILKLVLVEQWYHSTDVRERASDIVQRVGSNANLDRTGRLHGLDNFVCRNPAQAHSTSPITMTATVEAIIGAVYLDGGMNNVSQVMLTMGLVAT